MKLHRIRPPGLLSLLMVCCLVSLTTACPGSSASAEERARRRERFVAVGEEVGRIASVIAANETLPDQLWRAGTINTALRDKLVEAFGRARLTADELVAGHKAVLEAPNLNAATLVPVVARLIQNVGTLSGLTQLDAVRSILSGVEVALRAVANYFAVTRAEMHRRGYTDRQLARAAGVVYDRRAVEVIAAYAERPAYEPSS